jgi:hypothetical protein
MMTEGTSGRVRKLALTAAGLLLAYAGYTLLNTINASPNSNPLSIGGQLLGVGLIVYGGLIVAGYVYSLISGRSRPGFSRVPFIPRSNDPGITKEDRVKALEELREQGLLTPEQFEKKRADVLNKKW